MNGLVLASYALMVTIASLRPGGGSSMDPWDKLLHFITYAFFAVLACRVFTERRHAVYACLCVVAYGGLMELIQSWMPGRFMSGHDFLANTLGVVAGACAMGYVRRNRI